jgi:hypothetical protein
MVIHDCFIFNDEVSVLAFRLKYLSDVVDKFVIAESSKSFSGNPKELMAIKAIKASGIDETRITLIQYEFPNAILKISNKDRWPLERYARQVLYQHIEGLPKEDFVLLSDVDEIPSEEQIIEVRKRQVSEIVRLRTPLFFGKANWASIDGENWMTVKIGPSRLFRDLNEIRYRKCQAITNNPGAHLSFLYTKHNDLAMKSENWAHIEFDRDRELNKQIFVVAEDFQVIHTGQFFRKGYGVLKNLLPVQLNDVQQAFLKQNPEFFEFTNSSHSLRHRRYVSYFIEKSRQDGVLNIEEYSYPRYVFIVGQHMCHQVRQLSRKLSARFGLF